PSQRLPPPFLRGATPNPPMLICAKRSVKKTICQPGKSNLTLINFCPKNGGNYKERGGYVTDDFYGNLFLTLDSKISQRVLFMTEPQGAATLKMWGKNGNQLNLGSSDDGTWLDISNNGKKQNLIENN